MKKFDVCVCGSGDVKDGICRECRSLLRAKKSKSIEIVEKFRADYNRQHGTYKSYGQFVLLIDTISRRKKESDDRRKETVVKKVRRNRRTY